MPQFSFRDSRGSSCGVLPDRVIHLVTLGLLCVVAAMVWSILEVQGPASVRLSTASNPAGAALAPASPDEPLRQQVSQQERASVDAEFRKRLETWMEVMPPMEVHYSRINVSREPFLYGSILQDEDSAQVRDPNVAALEPGLTALWIHKAAECCAGGGAIIDVGSHFGYYSLLGASMGCSFVAVEPVPKFRAILETNVRLNGKEAVGKVLPFAVGFETKNITMDVPTGGNFGIAHVLPDGSAGTAVTQRPLDDMLAETPLPADVCLMKIDVEGREPSVIFTSTNLLSKSRVRHIMLEFSPGYSTERLAEMLGFLHDQKYQAWEIGWQRARPGQQVSTIDPTAVQGQPIDISTAEARQRIIDRVTPAFNTNMWFSPADG